ncbi:FecR family protein [Pedobacter caeni]|uniref:FecR family protein n=1 Tax=Pedobacter caeni TaxID=288992 RepID=A0A1M5EGE7_9SPHI|nr:FecR domain-containing protein [Pedobacter caeni]SHF78240.1 FecR family protein [Pedobacter caeni]
MIQMPAADFNVEELICNESFQEYCLGTSLENQMHWREWMARYPHRQNDIAEAEKIVMILNVKQGSRIEQLKALRSGLTQSETFRSAIFRKEELKPKHSRSYLFLSSVAAAMLIGIAFLYFYKPSFLGVNKDDEVKSTFFHSGKALRKTIILKDGSVITLARESSIRLPEDFNSSKRELWLNGAAFFDVKHDTAHPFIVHTTFNDIKVLGTTFNVKAYADSALIETALIQGMVRINSKKYPGYFVVLKPNQKLVSLNAPVKNTKEKPGLEYQVSELKNSPEDVAPPEVQWVRKRLDIDNLPLSVIAQRLQDWYGIEILIREDEVRNYRYSGVFENETILKTLEALQLSYPFRFEIKGDKIYIHK